MGRFSSKVRLGQCLWLSVLWVAAASAAAEPPPLHVHQNGRIRILYQTAGPHAVDATDENANGIPDQVEDALTQTIAAQKLWVEALGFPDPLGSERYREAAFLDIRFRQKEELGTNGAAYDELRKSRVAGDPPGTKCISFSLATSVKPLTNLTPSHEYFHLIQYASTYFKSPWFTEGTARWSERGLGAGGLGPTQKLAAWPLPADDWERLYQRKYDAAEYFWNPLAERVDADGKIPESEALRELQTMTYTDGSAVLKDQQLVGWQLIREVLAELGRVDDVAFRELKYETWAEDNQRSPRNHRYILQAIEAVMKLF